MSLYVICPKCGDACNQGERLCACGASLHPRDRMLRELVNQLARLRGE